MMRRLRRIQGVFPAMTREGWWFIGLLAFGVMTVVTGYTMLSETDDELFHVQCGMEWWSKGTYTLQTLHPPLARVMDASLLYFREALLGPHAYPKRQEYMSRLVLSRLGTLPYYIFSCVMVFLWARKLFGEQAALWAMAVYVTLSSVTAHAMLATTDMGYTAMLLWALFMATLWLEEATPRRSWWLGVSLALMVGTKFSGLLHWPLGFFAFVVLQLIDNHRLGKRLNPFNKAHVRHGLLITLPSFIVILWLVYRCDFGPLVSGVKSLLALDQAGYGVWFYGPLTNGGVWSFFPVVFFYKTPLALFASSVTGAGYMARRVKRDMWPLAVFFPLIAALAILLSSMTSHINLGVRHVLPMYPLMAIGAGYGLWRLWQAGQYLRGIAIVLALSQFIGFCMYQPEHLAYFNILAGEHPEQITLDSDYDWGQSVIMLDEELQRRGVKQFYLCARKDALWSAQFVVAARMQPCPDHPVIGWMAVARAYRLLHPDNFTWLARVPRLEMIGKTMDLYYLPPRSLPRKLPAVRPAQPQPKPSIPPKNVPQMTLAPLHKPSLDYPAKP